MSDATDNSGDAETVDVEMSEASMSSRPHRRVPWRKRGSVGLITDATRTFDQNIRGRERIYLILQGVRIPFIIFAILAATYWQNWPLATVFFLISIPLPWIAVMLGNAQGEKRDPRRRSVYKPAAARAAHLEMQRQQQLTQHGTSDPHSPNGSGKIAIIDHDASRCN